MLSCHIHHTTYFGLCAPGLVGKKKIGGVDYFGKGHETILMNALLWSIALLCESSERCVLSWVTKESTLGTEEPS